MFAHAFLSADAYVGPGVGILFDTPGAMANASYDSLTGVTQLTGTGAMATFRIAVGVSSRYSCRVEVLVNVIAQLPLTFGSSYYAGSGITGEGLITIPDDATIRLRVAGPSTCRLSMEDYGAASRAFLTVIKIS